MSNATWTAHQMRQVRSLRQIAVLNEDVPRFDRVLEAARQQTGRVFIRAAYPFAVEVHPDDLRFDTEPVGKPWEGQRLTCRWAPATRQVEVVGTHEDGTLVEFRGAPHESLRLAVPQGSPLLGTMSAQAIAADRTLLLECVGWREEARRWVYAPA